MNVFKFLIFLCKSLFQVKNQKSNIFRNSINYIFTDSDLFKEMDLIKDKRKLVNYKMILPVAA